MKKTNAFKIVGKLQSQNLTVRQRASDGESYISGRAIIISSLEGANCEFEVEFFAWQKTKAGEVSKLFTSYSNLEGLIGRTVEVTGDIRESRFYSSTTSQMFSSQRLSGRFVRGTAETTPHEASFEISGFVLQTLLEKKNKAGEIYRYDLALGHGNWDNTKMSRLVFHVKPTDVEIVRGVNGYQIGQTVLVRGDLRFFVETTTKELDNEGGFGEPVYRTYTNKISNFFITSGSAPIVTEENGMYSRDLISTLVAAYKANDAKLMAEGAAKETPATETEAKVTSKQTSLI